MNIEDLNLEELKKKVYEEAEKKGIEIDEDELNAKILELSNMEPDELEKLNGGDYCGPGSIVTCFIAFAFIDW